MAVNDPFVTKAFAEKLNASTHVEFVADGNGDFTRALDLGVDLGAAGLGYRSRRFSLIIKDGVVTELNDE